MSFIRKRGKTDILILGVICAAIISTLIGCNKKEDISLKPETNTQASERSSAVTEVTETEDEKPEAQDNTFIFSDSNTRHLSEDEIHLLSKEKMGIARNEIYARHGRIFQDSKLADYFNNQKWYHGTVKSDEFDKNQDRIFNEFEKFNIDLIQKMEAAQETAAVTGYVLYTEGSMMYLDEVNTGGRTAAGEGDDRAIAYDFSNAEINVPGGVRSGLTVDVVYDIQDGIRTAREVYSDGDEKEPVAFHDFPGDMDTNVN